MVEQTIKTRNFTINDGGILTIINNLNIKYLKLLLIKDYHNKLIISAKIVDIDFNEYKTSKNCMKIFNEKNCFIYTPLLLKKFVGKKILLYQDNTAFKDNEELFRIKPINFELNDKKNNIKDYDNIPYFIKSGSLVFPHNYINKYFDNKIILYKISFDKTDISVMNNGFIYTFFFPYIERNYASFRLKQNKNGLSTNAIKILIKLSKICNKNLCDFKYHSIDFNEDFKFGFITFKEIKKCL